MTSATIFSLPNGGPGGAIWMFLIVAICFYLVMLSLAEMTSM
jgi:amino acid permease